MSKNPATGASKKKDSSKASSASDSTTQRKATTWVRGVTAYTVALAAFAYAATRLQRPIKQLFPGCPTWLWMVIALLPLVTAFLAYSLPEIIRRIQERLLGQWALKATHASSGYFRIGPYGSTAQDQLQYVRPDGEHEAIRAWIQSSAARILYLTGNSGSGKTSLLNAYAIPALAKTEPGWVTVRVRAFADAAETLRTELLRPGVIWDRAPDLSADDVPELIRRALRRLSSGACLLILFDQFEEVLILHERDPDRFSAVWKLLADIVQVAEDSLRVLLVLRSDYVGLLQTDRWRNLLPHMQEGVNWREVSAFRERDARQFIQGSGLEFGPKLMDEVFEQVKSIESTAGLVRPITVNLVGVALDAKALEGARNVRRQVRRRGGLIAGYLRDLISSSEMHGHAIPILRMLMDHDGARTPSDVERIASHTGISRPASIGCLMRLQKWGLTRTIDREQQFWEISHDFVARQLHGILERSRLGWAHIARQMLFPLGCIAWLAFFVGTPWLYRETVATTYITAEIQMTSNEPGDMAPPTLTSAELRLVASRTQPKDTRKSWTDFEIPSRPGNMELRATGGKTIEAQDGEQTEESSLKTTQFINFVGQLGDMRFLDAWKDAWIEAEASGTVDDLDWLDHYNDDESRRKLFTDFKEFYKLNQPSTAKDLAEFEGTPLGVAAKCRIYLNGNLVAEFDGQLVDTGGGFHHEPQHYELMFLPVKTRKF